MFRRSPSRSLSPWPPRSSPPSRSRSRSRSSSPWRLLSSSPSLSRSRSRSRSSSPSLSRSRSRSRSRSGRESETLAHRGALTMRVDHPNSESRAAIERKFGELQRRHDKLIKANTKITKKVNMLEDEIEHIMEVLKKFKRADSLPTAVLHFVHQLEKATMYFQFKKKARQKHRFEHYTDLLEFATLMDSPRSFAALLRGDAELMSGFSNIEDSDIECAAMAICWERTQTSQYEPVLMDLIYRRVCHVLQGDYVMDEDPEVELKKMMESDPDEYDRYFLQQPANYKEMSKEEAYKKYSELVSMINVGDKEALEAKRKRKSALATSSRNKEALEEKRKSALATSSRNKEFPKTKERHSKQQGLGSLATSRSALTRGVASHVLYCTQFALCRFKIQLTFNQVFSFFQIFVV